MASEVPIYLILGHGTEKIGETNERTPLPEGCTLVTYSEAGNASFMQEVCKTIHIFKDTENLELLANPVEHRTQLEEELGHSVHVYKPGSGVPELSISPMSQWDFYNNNIHYYQFMRSGVYTFPLKQESNFDSPFYKIPDDAQEKLLTNSIVKKNIEECSENIVYMNWKEFNGDTFRRLYDGAVYPTEELLEKVAKSKASPLVLGNQMTISLKNLIEQLGPGIYYYVICRADNEFYGKHSTAIKSFFMINYRYDFEDMSNEHAKYFKGEEGQKRLEAVKAFERAMEDAERSVEHRNTLVKLKRFIRFLQDYPKNIPEFEALPEDYKAFVVENQIIPGLEPFLTYIKKIERVRRVSMVQQNKSRRARRGGGKKNQTRKGKKRI